MATDALANGRLGAVLASVHEENVETSYVNA
jgi:hypothetical protein